MFVLFKAERNLGSVCDVVCAPPHYFNKPIVPADCCYIKRIADDPSSVVKLILLP